ncbi:MAG: hypothetical protein H8E31_11840 [Planctomycetes bacterium]|nr:hypothetical protein [Planctomycetota bacterium]
MKLGSALHEQMLRVPSGLGGSGVDGRELPPPPLDDVPAGWLSFGRAAPATAPIHAARDESRLALQAGGRKWLSRLRPGGTEPAHLATVDLAADPQELTDLGEAVASSELRAAARAFAAEEAVRGAADPGLDPERMALLRMMGYLDGDEAEDPAEEDGDD